MPIFEKSVFRKKCKKKIPFFALNMKTGTHTSYTKQKKWVHKGKSGHSVPSLAQVLRTWEVMRPHHSLLFT